MFGAGIFKNGGSLDKKKLAALVFSSATKRRLENLIHPLVRKKMASELAHQRGRVAVCDVPLLYEAGLQKYYSKLLL